MAKDKHKRHNEWCKGYKARGQREVNKQIKQEKHKDRLAKIAIRKEEGKTYTYHKNPYEKGTREYETERARRAAKHKESFDVQMGEVQRWARYFGRLDRDIKEEQEAIRKAAIKNRKIKGKGKLKNETEDGEMV